jgi:hypothetical protein
MQITCAWALQKEANNVEIVLRAGAAARASDKGRKRSRAAELGNFQANWSYETFDGEARKA